MTETRYDVTFDLSMADARESHTLTLPDGYVTRIGMMHSGASLASPGGVMMQAGYLTGTGLNGLIYRATNDHYAGPVGLLGLRCYAGERIYCQAVRAQDATQDTTVVPTLSVWVETDLQAPPPGLAQPLIDSNPPAFTHAISLAAPAAGADYAQIDSVNTEYRVVGAKLPFTASAASGNRRLRINGIQLSLYTGQWYVSSGSATWAQPASETPWARSIVFDTVALDAGDQYSSGTLYVQERALL